MDPYAVERVKAHLGIPLSDTSKDSKLERILAGTSAWFERRTGRSFAYAERTEKLDGDGDDEILLRHMPIDEEAGMTITVDGEELDAETEIEVGALILDPEAGILTRGGGWPEGTRNVVVTYSAGYTLPEDQDESGEQVAPNLPDDVEQAVIRLTARIYERSTAEGVASVSPASFSVAYKDGLDPEIDAAIEMWTRHFA